MNTKDSLDNLLRAATAFVAEAVVKLVTETLDIQENTIRQQMKYVRVAK